MGVIVKNISKTTKNNILFNMYNVFFNMFNCFRTKKGYFILLILTTILAIVLGVYAGVSFGGGVFAVDLGNIAYVKFLQNNTSLFGMIFSLIFSLFIFFALILLFCSKVFLVPLALMFYLYLVYSQVVVCVSLVMIYGIVNCLILLMVLMVYVCVIVFLFVLGMMHMFCYTNDSFYFKHCITFKNYVLWMFVAVIATSVIFCFMLSILKSFVILLVY